MNKYPQIKAIGVELIQGDNLYFCPVFELTFALTLRKKHKEFFSGFRGGKLIVNGKACYLPWEVEAKLSRMLSKENQSNVVAKLFKTTKN